MVRKANCCCGSTSIEVVGEPALNAICHCGNCRQRTGSAFGWQAYFSDDQIVNRQGSLSQYLIRDEQVRSFCSTCGTTLYWTSSFIPQHVGIAAGAFVDDPIVAPVMEAACDSRLEWLSFRDSLTPIS